MSWFNFNGVSSDELGLIITDTPFRPSWSEETEDVVIGGRVAKLKQHSGTYGNQDLSVNCVIGDISKISEIYNTLHGEGKLELSTDSGKIINASVRPLAPAGVALTLAELEVAFDCSPFAYSANPTTAEIATVYTAVENIGTVFSEPVFEITLQKNDAPILMGDVNFDGKVTPTDASMVLDEYSRVASGGEATFTPEQFAAADINGDGLITPSDAQAILDIATESAIENPNAIAQNVVLDVNGEKLTVGIPNAVISNGFTVTVDCGLKLIYYTTADGTKVNILQYSYGDLPLLHTGINYIKYTGNNVDKLTVTVNERWR